MRVRLALVAALVALPAVALPSAGLEARTAAATPMAGVYAVGGPAADYATLTAAVEALTARGVSGVVQLRLAPGTYAERVRIPPVAGTSPTAFVLITSADDDPASVRIAPPVPASSAENYAVWLDGAPYVRVVALTFVAPSREFQTALLLGGEASGVRIVGNVVEGTGAHYSYATTDAAVRTHAPLRGDGLLFALNTVTDAGEGLLLEGDPAAPPTGLRLVENAVQVQSGYAALLEGFEAPFVVGNELRSYRGHGQRSYGLFLVGCPGPSAVRRNVVYAESDALSIRSSSAEAGAPADLTNNFVTGIGGNPYNTVTAIELSESDGWHVLHNSIWQEGAYGSGFRLRLSERTVVMNNIFAAGSGDSPAYEVFGDVAPFESGHNALYSQTSNVGAIGSTEYDTLESFLAALDALDPEGTEGEGTVYGYPGYGLLFGARRGDLHVERAAFQGMGLDVGVTEDIDGEPRPRPSGTPPDIGADEDGAFRTGPLSGPYVVGGPAADFVSLSEAATALGEGGVDGPVQLGLEAGTYEERVVVGPVAGASESAPVTITSLSGDPADAVVTARALSADEDFVVHLDGAAHVRLQSLTLVPQRPAFRTGVLLSGDVTGVRVVGTVIPSPTRAASLDGPVGADGLSEADGARAAGGGRAAIRSGAPLTGDGVLVASNVVTDGIALDGDPAAPPTGLRVVDNVVEGAVDDGIALSGLEAPSVVRNAVVARRFGLRLDGVSGPTVVRRNRVLANAGAVLVNESDASVEAPAELSNTFATTRQRRSDSGQSLDVRFSDHWRVVHNSVVAIGGRAALFVRDGEGLEVRNNAVAAFGAAVAYEVRGALPGLESGHNALIAQGDVGRVGPTPYATLPAFLAALDAVDEGPEGVGTFTANLRFVDAPNGDLHTTSPALQGAGLDVGVASDVDGEPRPRPAGTAPDVGADEVEPSAVAASRPGAAVPAEFALGAPRPNPSRGAVAVPVAVPEAGPVSVEVWDLLGRRVAVLAEGRLGAGTHEVGLDASALAPGVYVVRMRAEGFEASRRITVVR